MGKKFDFEEYRSRRFCQKFGVQEEQPRSKIRYYIDEGARTIVAVMDDCSYDAIDILAKMGIENIRYDGYTMDKFMMNETYRGKAKCAPEDEWDEDEGMRIARNRMLAGYYRARTMALMRAESVLATMMDELGSRIDYSDARCERAYGENL